VDDEKTLLRTLAGEALHPPPIWIMRQAGRYLPEYQATRKIAGSFLDLCFTPELAAEVTLQPVRRFDFDAAILFSDILVVPHGLGQGVRFEDGVGPVLDPLPASFVSALSVERMADTLEPVLETVRLTRAALPGGKALIGFCGAPWTVATYMIAGRSSSDHLEARRFALEKPRRLEALIEILVESSARYLLAQIAAGADVVKIFDSWAGVLDAEGFERFVTRPIAAIVARLKAERPAVPVIAFPRGAGARLEGFAERTGVDGVAVDWTVPIGLARKLVAAPVALQGNLDPLRLVVGGDALDEEVDRILAAMRDRAHIFNLGHGITPDTPTENVARLVERVRRG
jgi:uroporphyrinogen decarboxylase